MVLFMINTFVCLDILDLLSNRVNFVDFIELSFSNYTVRF